ncbi:DUF3131 domain-containing protein [Maridesulfovibrio ferrireducens]|uniref:DUF3131 domain-containing protein n=1 Tax=Maridesulfovibrio ferrireducens TaxID=246191 RepID=UPI001A2D6607|nr:DUF3131 domain-containing protein [Maridesulfovibrio ferrireducens]MBI9113078.1 DUF3131 domain-containing protein [Maridesulfovibrio ferrireducens]
MKFFRILITTFAICLMSAISAVAAFDGLGQLVSSPTFAEAVALYKNGKFEPSAMILQDLAENMRGLSPEVSGIVFVMASRAAENAGNARAYESWGMATARFARAGMSWDEVRKNLDQQLEMARLGAAGPAPVGAGQAPGFAGPAVSLPPEAGRMATAWELFGLKNYIRPSTGLRREKTADQIWNNMGDAGQGPVTVIPYSEGIWGHAPTNRPQPNPNISGINNPLISKPTAVPRNHSSAAAAATIAAASDSTNSKPELNETYRDAARLAWSYFQRNYQSSTGLYNGLDLYSVTTVWEIGSSLAALNAAYELELIRTDEFKQRAGLMLQTLSSMDLYNNELPNKLYFAESARMVGEDQKPTSSGIGWVGPDVARLLLWLKKTATLHPEFKPTIENIFRRMRTERLVTNGVIYSMNVYAGKEIPTAVSGFGYGSYAAEGLKLWGFNAWSSGDYRKTLGYKDMLGVKVPYDESAKALLSSKPFVLTLMEFGKTGNEQDKLIRRIYEVQVARFNKTKTITSASDGRLDRAPWFATSAIISENGNETWQCTSPYSDKPVELFWSSTAMAFGWDALYNTAYTRMLIEKLSTLSEQGKGFYAGKYDTEGTNKAITLETNALILEAAMYRKMSGIIEPTPNKNRK